MATVPVAEGNGAAPTVQSETTRPPETRGRPRIREDDEILDAAEVEPLHELHKTAMRIGEGRFGSEFAQWALLM